MPDPDSVRIMAAIDELSEPMRELVYEYGHNVVLGMIADGHRDPAKLRTELQAWRERRQEEIAHTNWFEKAPPIAPNAPPAFSIPVSNDIAAQDGGIKFSIKPDGELSLTELFPDIR